MTAALLVLLASFAQAQTADFDGDRRALAPLEVSVPADGLQAPRSGLAKVLSRDAHEQKLDFGLFGLRCGGVKCFAAAIASPILMPAAGAASGGSWAYAKTESYLAAVLGGVGGLVLGILMIPVCFIEGLLGGISGAFHR